MSEWGRFLRRCATAHRVVIEKGGPVRLTPRRPSPVDVEAKPNDTEMLKGGDQSREHGALRKRRKINIKCLLDLHKQNAAKYNTPLMTSVVEWMRLKLRRERQERLAKANNAVNVRPRPCTNKEGATNHEFFSKRNSGAVIDGEGATADPLERYRQTYRAMQDGKTRLAHLQECQRVRQEEREADVSEAQAKLNDAVKAHLLNVTDETAIVPHANNLTRQP
jgi:hypothetical protein